MEVLYYQRVFFFKKTNGKNLGGLIYECKYRASGPAVYGEKCFKILYSVDFIEKLVHCVKNLGKEIP